MWATCNIGAKYSKDYGDYFAWGEVKTAPSSNYSEENCSAYGVYTLELNERGVVDANIELTNKYDAATSNWGKGWRMPTNEDFNELLNSCIWEWANLEGVDEYKVSSKENNNWIFLPATGYHNGTSSNDVGSYGYYWSSSVFESSSRLAYDLRFSPNSKYTHSYYRYYVRSVSPVSE